MLVVALCEIGRKREEKVGIGRNIGSLVGDHENDVQIRVFLLNLGGLTGLLSLIHFDHLEINGMNDFKCWDAGLVYF